MMRTAPQLLTQRMPLALAAALIGLSACAPQTRVTLLSQAGSAVEVRPVGPDGREGAQLHLDRPWQTVDVSRGQARPGQTTQEQVQATHGRILAAMPPAPLHQTLYFETGATQLTAASAADLQALMQRLKDRMGIDIAVIGHTDRVGSDSVNDALSLERAQALREQIIGLGFPAERITAAGRGEREPLIATEDGAAEPRNRRVEIQVY